VTQGLLFSAPAHPLVEQRAHGERGMRVYVDGLCVGRGPATAGPDLYFLELLSDARKARAVESAFRAIAGGAR
jgi:hypothetical protein